MDKFCHHQKLYNDHKNEYYFFTWSIPETSMIDRLDVSTSTFKMLNGCSYFASLRGSEDEIAFRIKSESNSLKCFFSIIIGSKAILLSNAVDKYEHCYTSMNYGFLYEYNLLTLSSENESFQKLKKDPNNSLTLICKIVRSIHFSTRSEILNNCPAIDSLYYLKSLGAVLRNSSESSLKEKVVLQVGDETETVSKVVLCARSPVFTKMFENDMREVQKNVVNITDIKMPVLKALVSYLYTGKLSHSDLDFLCELYYATDKYEIADLRQMCVDFIIPQISMENILRVMKLAFSHNDELLKSTVMALIATNIETWFSTNDWRNLITDEPKIAGEVLNFFE